MNKSSSTGVVYRAFTGLRNDVPPERFTPTDLEVANNVDIDKSGCVSRRDGFALRLTTPVHSLWAHAGLALFVSAGQLKQLNADFTATALASVSGAVMAYCQDGGRTYFSDAVGTGILEAGAVRSWGLAPPPLPTPTLVAGDMPAGAYQFTATYLRNDGQESGAPGSASVVVGTGYTLQLAVPVPADASVSYTKLYLTPPNGELPYLVATLARATTFFTVTAANVAALVLPLATQLLQPAPPGQLLGVYRGRMFVAAGSILYMSEPFAYELFDLRNYIDLGATITLLAPLEDLIRPGLFVGTTLSCGALEGTGPEDFKYVAKVDYGAILGTTVSVDGTLIADGASGAKQQPTWMTTQGICIGMPGMEIINHTRGRYEVGASGVGAALFLPEVNRYLCVTGTSATAMRAESFAMTTYSNFAFNSFAAFDGAYLGARADGIYALTGATDAGAPIAATVRTGVTDFSSAFLKSLERVYVGYRCDAGMSLYLIADSAPAPAYAVPATGGVSIGGCRVKAGKGLSARYWQAELHNAAGAGFTLNAIELEPLNRQRRSHA